MTWDEDSVVRNLPALQKEGLMCWGLTPGMIYSFTLDGSSYIDVYVLRELTGISKMFWGKSCLSHARFETPRNLFTGWSEINFMGEKVTCPENPERLLEFWYGSDWRIPQDKKGIYRVRSAERFHRFLALFYRWPILWCAKQRERVVKVFKLIFSKDYRNKILQRKKETGSYFHKQ